jgi:hypothetical protein
MKKVYDPEMEFAKARLGLKFRCAVCGGNHYPQGGAWRRCAPKIPPVVKAGSFTIKIYENELEIVINWDRVCELYQHARNFRDGLTKYFSERAFRLVRSEVKVVQRYSFGAVMEIMDGEGNIFSDSVLYALFPLSVLVDDCFPSYYHFLDVSPDMEYAIIRAYNSQGNMGHYLLTRGNKAVQIEDSDAGRPIGEVVEKYKKFVD